MNGEHRKQIIETIAELDESSLDFRRSKKMRHSNTAAFRSRYE